MSVTNLGDLAHSYSMRQRNIALRQNIDRLTAELATGQVADVRDVLAGNHSYLTDIERRTAILNGYDVATSEAVLFASATQKALGHIETHGSELALSLLTAGTSAIGVTGSDTAKEATAALDGMIATLNVSSAGRYLFSGADSDSAALAGAEDLIAALRIAVSGSTTPDDILNAATIWFDDPAGFEATMYQGSSDAIAPFGLSETDNVALDIRAIDPKLREVLKLTAVAALADDATLGLDVTSQSELFEKSGQALLIAQDDVIALRADVGFIENRIEQVAARNAAERTSLEFAKVALLEIDPYEAATKLEEAQFQLQSLYSVTVRMSQLSLVNFL